MRVSLLIILLNEFSGKLEVKMTVNQRCLISVKLNGIILLFSFQITLLDTSMGSTGSGGFSSFLVRP